MAFTVKKITELTSTTPTDSDSIVGVKDDSLVTYTFANLKKKIASDTTATTATSVSGGTANSLVYQTAANTTGFIAAGSNGQVLTMVSGKPAWSTLNVTDTIDTRITTLENKCSGLSDKSGIFSMTCTYNSSTTYYDIVIKFNSYTGGYILNSGVPTTTAASSSITISSAKKGSFNLIVPYSSDGTIGRPGFCYIDSSGNITKRY